MRCYYEELGVERDSNESEIKVAYRKQALRWHPDKNPERSEEAKERFQLIQQAYEVLSDPQERAWYDNHREQILRGKNSEYEDNCLDVFQYFTVSCYKGYDDDANGFYSVYREVFKKLAAEDAEFMKDEENISAIPIFGDSQSSYDDVVGPFYAYWQSYSTKKKYEWLCPYNIMEIKDRRILREIEKEMKKIVQKARKERNEEVRNLVSFIRKRDRRVHAYRQLLEERATVNRKKQQEKRMEQFKKRQQELAEVRANSSNTFNAGYEEQLKQLAQEYGSDSSYDSENDEYDDNADSNDDADESDSEYVDDLYCVACNKSFKNANAFANHETSKKHRENIEQLKLHMQEEENNFNELSDDRSVSDVEAAVNEIQLNGHQSDTNETVDMLPTEDTSDQTNQKSRNRKTKKSKKTNKTNITEPQVSDHEHEITAVEFATPTKVDDNSDNDNWNSSSKKAAKKNKNKKQINSNKKSHDPAVKQQQTVEKIAPTVEAPTSTCLTTDDNITLPAQHVCVTCNAVFESKNKLFAHLKKTNHGVYIPKPKTEVAAVEPNQKKAKARRKEAKTK